MVTSDYNLMLAYHRSDDGSSWARFCRFEPETDYPQHTHGWGRSLDYVDGRVVVGVPSLPRERKKGAVLGFELSLDGGEPDSAEVQEDQSVTIDVRANDTAEGEPRIVVAPNHGDALVVDGQIRYEPEANFSGRDRLTYRLADAGACASPTPVEVAVQPVNDPPVAENDRVTVEAGGFAIAEVLKNDSDADGDDLELTIVSRPERGEATILRDDFKYVPDPGTTGEDSLVYRIDDGRGERDEATLSIHIIPATDPGAEAAGGEANGCSDTSVATGSDGGEPCRGATHLPWRNGERRAEGCAGCSAAGRPVSWPGGVGWLLILAGGVIRVARRG